MKQIDICNSFGPNPIRGVPVGVCICVLLCIPKSYGGDTAAIDSAGDRIVFSPASSPLDAPTQKYIAAAWQCDSEIRARAADSYPFGDDIELGDFRPRVEPEGREGVSAIHRRGTDEYAWCTWNSMSRFIIQPRTAKQCCFILESLHGNWFQARLTGQQCVQVMLRVKNEAGSLPFRVKVLPNKIRSATADCVRSGDVWFSHFAIIEGASLVEYEYAVGNENRIARNRRVLVEGPRAPLRTARDVFESGFATAATTTEAERDWMPCRQFLLAAAQLSIGNESFASGDARQRLFAVRAFNGYYFSCQDELCKLGLEAVPELRRSLLDPNEYVRAYSQSALSMIDHRRLIKLLHADLGSGDVEVRRRTISALGMWEQAGYSRELIDALGDRDLLVRRDAANALRASEADYLALAIQQLSDRDAGARAAAAWALGYYGSVAIGAAPNLRKLLTDSDSNVRRSTADALSKIENAMKDLAHVRQAVQLSDVRSLGKALSHEDRAVRVMAASGLLKLGTAARGAVPDLRDVLKNETSDIRREVVMILKNIGVGATPAVPELAHLVCHITDDRWSRPYAPTAPQDRAEEVRGIAVEVLSALGPEAEEAVGELRMAMKDRRASLRQTSARLLGRIGPSAVQALPDLKYALSDPSSPVRESAADALRQIDPLSLENIPSAGRKSAADRITRDENVK